jgi:hypothetical protein
MAHWYPACPCQLGPGQSYVRGPPYPFVPILPLPQDAELLPSAAPPPGLPGTPSPGTFTVGGHESGTPTSQPFLPLLGGLESLFLQMHESV